MQLSRSLLPLDMLVIAQATSSQPLDALETEQQLGGSAGVHRGLSRLSTASGAVQHPPAAAPVRTTSFANPLAEQASSSCSHAEARELARAVCTAAAWQPSTDS